MHILALVAGTNHPSNSDTLADSFLQGAASIAGTTVEKLYLRDLPLPHFMAECYGEGCLLPKEYQLLHSAIQKADGVLVATPIWNFSVPAHLKNTIDWIGVFGLDADTRSVGQLHEKPFTFIFTGGAPSPAWKGLMRFTTMHVPEAFRYFGATILRSYYEPKATLGRGKFGRIVDKRPESLAKVRTKGEKFARFVERFKKTGRLPLWQRILEKAYNMGQKVVSKL